MVYRWTYSGIFQVSGHSIDQPVEPRQVRAVGGPGFPGLALREHAWVADDSHHLIAAAESSQQNLQLPTLQQTATYAHKLKTHSSRVK